MPLGIISEEEFESELQNSNSEFKNSIVEGNTVGEELPPRAPENITSDNVGEIITSADIIQLKSAGRNLGDMNVPDSLRKIIGEESQLSGRKSALQLAESFGISPSQVSSYNAGRTSPDKNSTNDALINYLEGRKATITKKALNKLSLAISLIDEENLKECEPRILSTIARDLSMVVGNIEPSSKKEDEKKEPVQFHFYAPHVKNEHHYETVVAKDNY